MISIHRMNRWHHKILILCLIFLSVSAFVDTAHANTTTNTAANNNIIYANPPGKAVTDGVCMSDIVDKNDLREMQAGIITQSIDYIKSVVHGAMEDMYRGIIRDSGFQDALSAAFTLSIIVFGVSFMFGIVPFTLGQALVRILKISVIYAATAGGGFAFFNEYAIRFFSDGVDDIIGDIITIATGNTISGMAMWQTSATPQPFRELEAIAISILSPQMMSTLIASFTTGVMGPAMGTLLGAGIIAFLLMVVEAMKVYCISMIARAFLLGLAPIFLVFLLFQKTQHIFDGWLNQLVNYSLQPILLFAFISFYMVLLNSSSQNILSVDTCWVAYDNASGSGQDVMQWRFVDPRTGKPTPTDFSWEGAINCLIDGGNECPDFPISIIDLLIFLILTHLAWRFSDVVTLIATEIASSTLNLKDLRSGLNEYFSRAQRGGAT